MEAARSPWPALGVLLIRDGLVSREELEQVLANQGDSREWRVSSQRLGEALVERGIVASTQVARLVAEQHELPFIELTDSDLTVQVAVRLPEDLARRCSALPIREFPDASLLVVVADPTTVMRFDDVRRALGVPIRFAVAAPDAIAAAIDFAHSQAALLKDGRDEATAAIDEAALEDESSETEPELSADEHGEGDRPTAETPDRAWPVLGSLLVQDGLVTEDELDAALAQQRLSSTRRLGEILVARGVLTERHVARALAEQHEVPFVDLDDYEVDLQAASLLPHELRRRHSALPVAYLPDRTLLVAVADPTSAFAADEVRAALGVPLQLAVAVADQIHAAMDALFDGDRSALEPDDTEPPAIHDGGGGDTVRLFRVAPPPTTEEEEEEEEEEEVFRDEGGPAPAEAHPADVASATADTSASLVEVLRDEGGPAPAEAHPANVASATADTSASLVEPGPAGAGDDAEHDDTEYDSTKVEGAATIAAACLMDVGPDGEVIAAPGPPLLDQAIQEALSLGASDIHFTPQADGLVVRARIDGLVQKLATIPREQQDDVTAALKAMGHLDPSGRRAPEHGPRVVVPAGDSTIEMRIAVLPTMHGERVAVRVLGQANPPDPLLDLFTADHAKEAVRRALRQPSGMFVICGPAGSGRTTTLYAAVRELNTPERTLMTIEDPVEYLVPGIDQTEVDLQATVTFASGLRTILRSDPDIVVVGELLDHETARTTVNGALAGRLVLSTLHARSAAAAVRRLTEMGVEPGDLGSALTYLAAQRLVRRVCLDCRETYYATAEDLVELERPSEEAGRRLLGRGRGCDACGGTGYRGRVALFEVLPLTRKIRTLVAGGASTAQIHRKAVAAGMRTLHEDGIRLCLEGVTTRAEVQRVVGDAVDQDL